ncbi:glycoside hydrolase family 30 protein [Chitinophaga vietnamensis]|uniref:glycoside hydrolase family 30 protein n=1 Tax=Chitinophaga vietnamensis TaxID=2593957 RepID=UPI00191BDAAD|nr:glycoside hydrolase family 30 beta sandwich domain-containing protein [Chitinophaga vietnamensis]
MKTNRNIFVYTFLLLMGAAQVVSCQGNKNTDQPTPVNPEVKTDVQCWLTNPDRTALLQKQNISLLFSASDNGFPTIDVDDTQSYQSIDGFGFTLTGGSATLINKLPADQQNALLRELFLPDSNGIGISYLRLSIGASDLSASVFTYDEMPAGQTDPQLAKFSIDKEREDLIPVLKKILALNPNIKILGSPWTAPTWMKTNNAFIGGSLKPENFQVYANYFVKYIQAMKAEGITIDAITPQNEPLHGGNNPSMVMLAPDQAIFVKANLGPAFKAAGLSTKIILYDHNADRPDYPISILNDPAAYPFVDGSAFHLYGGQITALSVVHSAFPDKNVYFTEQWSDGKGSFANELKGNTTNLTIGATRNWSRNVLQWNLASDPQWNPHTDNGGCSQCLGAVTIGGTIYRNSSYYVIGHASKFVRPGAVRIASTITNQLDNVAFKTPDGKHVLIVVNNNNMPQQFQIRFKGKLVGASLNNGAVGTYIW